MLSTDRQTDRQTNATRNITSFCQRGNNNKEMLYVCKIFPPITLKRFKHMTIDLLPTTLMLMFSVLIAAVLLGTILIIM